VKRILNVTLGIVTSIGGYLDVGAIATAAQAGARFRFALLWVILLGTICVIALVEMSGRLAAISGHTLRGAERERMGLSFFAWTTLVGLSVNVLVLSAEIGGVAFALQLVTGIPLHWWSIVVAFAVWLVIWNGTFSAIEKGLGTLGLVTLAFAVAAVRSHPPIGDVLGGFVPSMPAHDQAQYWFIAVGILGALISPYLFYFYSSGAVEDGWDEHELGINRLVASAGMGFGSITAFGVLIVSAMVFHPAGIKVTSYAEAAHMLSPALGRLGVPLFAASLGVACFGAATEISLTTGYVLAQGLGWEWGERKRPREAPRFAVACTAPLLLGVIPALLDVQPLGLTTIAMAITALTLPAVVVPFLVIMNDRDYVKEHVNGRVGNAIVLVGIGLAFLLALVTIPLEFLGG
jgi:Mn2+/Fe2+ NRAMP family transporter